MHCQASAWLTEVGWVRAQKASSRTPSPDGPLPLLVSSCPGWVVYAEKTHGSYILPYLSHAKSPQACSLPSHMRRPPFFPGVLSGSNAWLFGRPRCMRMQ